MRSIRLTALPMMMVVLCLTLLLSLAGCSTAGGGGSSKLAPAASLAKPAQVAQDAAVAAETPLSAAEAAAAKLPDSQPRLDLVKALAGLRTWWASNLAAWQSTTATAQTIDQSVKERDAKIAAMDAQAKKDAAEIARLKANDPMATKASWLALGLGLLCVALVGVGIWLGISQLKIVGFIAGGASLFCFAAARIILALDRIPDWVIYLAILLAIGGAAAVYWLLNRRVTAAKAANPVVPTPTPPAGPVITNAPK